MSISIEDAMRQACERVGILVPSRVSPGVWAKSAVVGKSRKNTSGRVLIFDDSRGGVAHNWATGEQEVFRVDGSGERRMSQAERREIAERRKERLRKEKEQHETVIRVCSNIVRTCRVETHPYLERKGFPSEVGLVHEDPRKHMLGVPWSEHLIKSMPEFSEPLLVVPGRIGKTITTVQFITADGNKKNIRFGKMDGASHRLSTGRETWVAEGIATALTIRAALRLLSRSATVLCAFSAANTAKVASQHAGSILAADHDKPVEQFGGQGTGEFYARRTGHVWSMPPVRGDFNDLQESDGLRSVALHLRGVAA